MDDDSLAHCILLLFLLILQLNPLPSVLGLLDFVLRGIAFVDDVHDFVDVLFGEVIAVKGRVVGERGIAGGEETAQAATGLQPVPQVLEGPADAGPEEGDSAEVHQHDDDENEQHAHDDAHDGGDAVICLFFGLPILLRHKGFHFLLRDGIKGV